MSSSTPLLQAVFPSLNDIKYHGYLLTLLVKFAFDEQYQWNKVIARLNKKVAKVLENGYPGYALTEDECKDLFHLIIKDFRAYRRYPDSVPQAEFIQELLDMLHSAVIMDIQYDLHVSRKKRSKETKLSDLPKREEPADIMISESDLESNSKKSKKKQTQKRKAQLDPVAKRRKTEANLDYSSSNLSSKNQKKIMTMALQEIEDHRLGYLFVSMKKNYDAHPHGCKKLLDIKSIKSNVSKGDYDNIIQFFEDCMLMLANIVMLCPEDLVVKKNALEMMKFIQDKFSITASAQYNEDSGS
eukprot:NODE_214_length_14327_cov_0.392325.p5 type:complete len:299 gc:universal NODE_214_length_14327_cov_0.392325:11316-12212(+)